MLFRSPVASWYENEICPEPECRISVTKLLSLVEDKGLDESAESWDLKTCELYRHKQVPILPLELTAEGEEDKIESCRIEAEDAVVGRSLEADVVLDDPTISRQHAFLRCSNGELAVTDLHSSNGTFLNGVALEPLVETRFQLHDDLRLGCVRIRLRSAEPMTVAAYKLLAERQIRNRMQKSEPKPSEHWAAPTKLLPKISMRKLSGQG